MTYSAPTLVTVRSHSYVRNAKEAAGRQRWVPSIWSISCPHHEDQSPSSKGSESLRSCASLPCSDERLVYLQAPLSAWQAMRRKGPGGGAGDRDGPEAQSRRLLSPLLLASLPFQTYFLDPSTPFQGIATIPTCSHTLCLSRVPCFGSSRSAELGSRSNRELCDFREDALSLGPLKSERTFSTRWGFDP